MNNLLEQKTHNKKTEYLYAQANNVIAGNTIAACLLVIIYWSQLYTGVLVGWFAAVLCVQAYRLFIASAYCRRDRYSSGSENWYRVYAKSALLNGCLWGAIGVYIAHQSRTEQLPYMLMIIGALVACSSITKSALFAIYARFSTPALVAPGIYLMTQYSSDKFMIGVLVLCWFALMYSAAWRFRKFVSKSLRFEFENIELLAELEASRTCVVRLKKNADLQTRRIETLEQSNGAQPLRCATENGTRLTTAKEKNALRLARS